MRQSEETAWRWGSLRWRKKWRGQLRQWSRRRGKSKTWDDDCEELRSALCYWWEVRDGKQMEEDEMSVQCLVHGVKHLDFILKLMRVKKETN